MEQVAADHDAQRVTRVRVWLGAFSHITPAHFHEHFEGEARGTFTGESGLGGSL